MNHVSVVDPIPPAQVLLVESDPLVAQRLRELLLHLGYRAESLVTAGSVAQARASINCPPFVLALVESPLPDGNSIDLIAELRRGNPELSILVMSTSAMRDNIFAALRAGADGYMLKERDDMEVALALRSISKGGVHIDPFVVAQIVEELCSAIAPKPVKNVLSVRENEILRLVAKGLTNRDIAARLFLSRYTVQCHVRNVYRKLSVRSRTQAANAARQHGLLD